MYCIANPMVKYFLTIVCVWMWGLATAQNQNNQWRFGIGGAIDFSVNPPASIAGCAISTPEGSASIADSRTGRLLFYTDGVTVWDSTNTPMPNGTGLFGGGTLSSTSAALIVPKPLTTNIFFLFTIDEQFGPNGLSYSIVDMTLNNGKGDIQPGQKNISLFNTASEKLCAVPKADGCGYWLITHDNPGNSFYAFEVNSAGVQTFPVVSTAGYVQANGAGYMKVNRQLNKLVLGYLNTASVELFDFDNSTGIISNPLQWAITPATSSVIYGCEFSRDGSLLYVSSLEKIYQFNIALPNAAAISASQYQVSQGLGLPPFYQPASLQLGPDNKIYIASGRIDAINFPDRAGAACDFQIDAIPLASGTGSNYGLPQWVYKLDASPFDNAIKVADTCASQVTQFSLVQSNGATSVSWNFGDPLSGAQNTTTGTAVTHQFTQPGVYSVQAILTYPCINDTVTRQVSSINCSPVTITGIKVAGDTCDASQPISFQATGITSSPFFFWNFGDTASGTNDTITITGLSPSPFPNHLFSAPGVYNVCVSYQEPGFPVAQVCRTFKIGLCCTGSPTGSTTNVSICDTELPYSWNGLTCNSAGNYQVTLVNSSGCDSVASLVLSVGRVTTSNTSFSVCSNQFPYTWNTLVITTPGSYTDTLLNIAGCDSIARLIISASAVSNSNTVLSICSNQLPFNWNGVSCSGSGTYTATLVNANGCDSIARLVLTVNATGTSSDTSRVCSNQLPFTWNGQTINAAGNYTANLRTVNGCDSFATLSVQLVSAITDTTRISRCASALPFVWNAITINAAGTFKKQLVSVSGCDSVAVLILTVPAATTSTTPVTICVNQLPYRWNGNDYTGAGSYQVVLLNAAGCDSTARLELQTTNTLSSITSVTACANYLPYRFNGVEFYGAGSFDVPLTSFAGCDSIATLQLQVSTINTPNFPATDTSICAGTSLLLQPGLYSSYRWQDGSRNATFNVTSAGMYRVTVTNADGCVDSAFINVALLDDCQSIYFPSAISSAANSNNKLFGPLGNLNLLKDYRLNIYSRWGQLVFTSNNPFQRWDGTYRGTQQANWTFSWYATYTINGRVDTRKGTLVVLQ